MNRLQGSILTAARWFVRSSATSSWEARASYSQRTILTKLRESPIGSSYFTVAGWWSTISSSTYVRAVGVSRTPCVRSRDETRHTAMADGTRHIATQLRAAPPCRRNPRRRARVLRYHRCAAGRPRSRSCGVLRGGPLRDVDGDGQHGHRNGLRALLQRAETTGGNTARARQVGVGQGRVRRHDRSWAGATAAVCRRCTGLVGGFRLVVANGNRDAARNVRLCWNRPRPCGSAACRGESRGPERSLRGAAARGRNDRPGIRVARTDGIDHRMVAAGSSRIGSLPGALGRLYGVPLVGVARLGDAHPGGRRTSVQVVVTAPRCTITVTGCPASSAVRTTSQPRFRYQSTPASV